MLQKKPSAVAQAPEQTLVDEAVEEAAEEAAEDESVDEKNLSTVVRGGETRTEEFNAAPFVSTSEQARASGMWRQET